VEAASQSCASRPTDRPHQTHRREPPHGRDRRRPFVPVVGDNARVRRLARQLGERVAKSWRFRCSSTPRQRRDPEHQRLPNLREVRTSIQRAIRWSRLRPPTCILRRVTPNRSPAVLVAFNVVSDTRKSPSQKEIAKQIRTSRGGLPGVQASGFIVNGSRRFR